MKQIRLILLISIALILVLISVTSCSDQSKTADLYKGWKTFRNADFSFKYPADWKIATDGGDIGAVIAKEEGTVSLNDFNGENFWVTPVYGWDLSPADGRMITEALPENSVYMFVSKSIDGKSGKGAPYIEIDTPGKPGEFIKERLKEASSAPEVYKKDAQKIYLNSRDWINYRFKFTNHGNTYSVSAYLCDNAVKANKGTLDNVLKSFQPIKSGTSSQVIPITNALPVNGNEKSFFTPEDVNRAARALKSGNTLRVEQLDNGKWKVLSVSDEENNIIKYVALDSVDKVFVPTDVKRATDSYKKQKIIIKHPSYFGKWSIRQVKSKNGLIEYEAQ